MINTRKILLLGFFLGLVGVAVGCSPAQPTMEPGTEVAVETEQATVPPTEAPSATAPREEITEEPEETDEPDQSETDEAMSSGELSACVECHTDQAMLIDTADPVEEAESENEGAG